MYDPAKFDVGMSVRIADQAMLDDFRQAWTAHNPLTPEQLPFARKVATVKRSFMYHGGDILYELDGAPGIWHECVLEPL